MTKFKPDDLVVTTSGRPQRPSRAAFVPGKQGGVGGSGAAWMRPGQVYRVLAVTANGGVRLHNFSLLVSVSELALASPEQVLLDKLSPVPATSDCRQARRRCWRSCWDYPGNLDEDDRFFPLPAELQRKTGDT